MTFYYYTIQTDLLIAPTQKMTEIDTHDLPQIFTIKEQ